MSTNIPATPFEKFVAALVAPFQVIEDTLQQMYLGFMIDNAVGEQLTWLGKKVGREREGYTDDDMFRRLVRAQIIVNSSDGIVEDLLAVAELVIYDNLATYRIAHMGGAELELHVEGVIITRALARLLVSFLRQTVAGGVRLVLLFKTAPDATLFSTAGGPGLGYLSTDGLTGGAYAAALE